MDITCHCIGTEGGGLCYTSPVPQMKTCWKESELLRKIWVNPCSFTCALAVGNVRMILVSPTTIPRLRGKPNVKISKILVKGWSNVQSNHLKQRFYMDFTGNRFWYKGISIVSRSNNAKSDVSAHFTIVWQEFLLFLHWVFSWAEIWLSGIWESCVRLALY